MEERKDDLKLNPNSMQPNGLRKDEKEVNQNETSISTNGIFVKNLTAKWSPEYTENTLSNISLTVKPGELLAVIGKSKL